MLVMHRAYEGELGEKKRVYFVADGKKVQKLSDQKAQKWLSSLESGVVLRVTQAHSTDVLLLDLATKGVKVQYAHWHSTGIEKGLAGDVIADSFYKLDDSLFRPFIPRSDLAELRHFVDVRQAIMEHRKADLLRLCALKRSLGFTDESVLPKELKTIEDEINSDKRKFETPVDKKVADIASKIPECVAFNAAAGVSDGWATAATVVAFFGDISRFPCVASLWHYSGQHVEDGKAPKRQKGKPGSWNPRIRTSLWMLGTSIIKNRNNRWRPVYEQFLDKEIAEHDTKHANCPTKQGHCGARARRKVVKEILKEFYLTICGEKPQGIADNHNNVCCFSS